MFTLNAYILGQFLVHKASILYLRSIGQLFYLDIIEFQKKSPRKRISAQIFT
jgi:hypothetical protein